MSDDWLDIPVYDNAWRFIPKLPKDKRYPGPMIMGATMHPKPRRKINKRVVAKRLLIDRSLVPDEPDIGLKLD